MIEAPMVVTDEAGFPKYYVHIPETYWKESFPDWDHVTVAEKLDRKIFVMRKVEKMLKTSLVITPILIQSNFSTKEIQAQYR